MKRSANVSIRFLLWGLNQRSLIALFQYSCALDWCIIAHQNRSLIRRFKFVQSIWNFCISKPVQGKTFSWSGMLFSFFQCQLHARCYSLTLSSINKNVIIHYIHLVTGKSSSEFWDLAFWILDYRREILNLFSQIRFSVQNLAIIQYLQKKLLGAKLSSIIPEIKNSLSFSRISLKSKAGFGR